MSLPQSWVASNEGLRPFPAFFPAEGHNRYADYLVTTKVKTKLSDDNILRGVGISVDTLGGYVTLTGAMENEKDR